MRLGFHTVNYSPTFGAEVELPEIVEATAAAGFDALGIDLTSLDRYLARGGTVAELAAMFEHHGLACSDVAVLRLGAVDVEPTARRLAEVAATLAAPHCIAVVRDADDLRRLRSNEVAVPTVLREQGVRLAIEYCSYSGLVDFDAAVELCDAIGWEHAGLLIDALHVFRCNTPLDSLAALRADQIALVQYCDGPAQPAGDAVTDSRCRREMPGDGALPLRPLVDALKATGFAGPVTLEVLSDAWRAEAPTVTTHVAYAAMARDWLG